MIIVDKVLAARIAQGAPPIQVAMIGAGFLARGVALQVAHACRGAIRIAGIANRTPDNARRAFAFAGETDVAECTRPSEVEAALAAGRPVVCSDARLLAEARGIDVVLEMTGTIEPILSPVLAAIEAGKHVVVNAELDATLGPLLKVKADAAGVVYTGVDGDQPGTTMNLVRFVRGIGMRPVLCGNIKGLQDHYRTPATQAGFASRSGQSPGMVSSFADGTKISFEQAVTANAVGMGVARRGMHGFEVPQGTSIMEAAQRFSAEELIRRGGIVDYVIGASPGPGIFVLATNENAELRRYLDVYKLGEGPIYCFYTPCHLCNFEMPSAVARAVLFGDAVIAPAGPPRVEVIAIAKRDLRRGEVLDDPGHYMSYGTVEDAGIVAREGLLPIGVAPGCRLTRDVPCDAALSYADVELSAGRLCDRLREEQVRVFAGSWPGIRSAA